MSNILETARFDAGVNTGSGRKQFSFVETAGGFIGNREYKEGFDKFEAGCPCADQYVWRALSAVGDQTGRVLYENVKNYIDYVTNIDLCKIQSLRSMIKMYGLEYKVFNRLDMLPPEILDLLNIFSINKRYIVYGNKLLSSFQEELSAKGAICDLYRDFQDNVSEEISGARIVSSGIDYKYPIGGKYYDFVKDSFSQVLSGFLTLPYEKGKEPIYKLRDDYGIYYDYNYIDNRREKYAEFAKRGDDDFDLEKDIDTPYGRRQFKILNGIPLYFDEQSALDRIEAGIDPESMYVGAKAELIQIERNCRAKQISGLGKTSRYAFYKKQRVMDYANFVVNKYYSDNMPDNLSVYRCDTEYFQLQTPKEQTPQDIQQIYWQGASQQHLLTLDGNDIQLNGYMIDFVARSLADTALYISDLREKIKLQTRKNYMKGTYNLMLYVINEFLVDYARMNPMFRSKQEPLKGDTITVSELLKPIYGNLSSHNPAEITAIEYFDSTEYYNINSETDRAVSSILYDKNVNDRFWVNPGGEQLMRHDGQDADFDIASISSFYMDTLGMRDSYISDETSLCAFLDAVFGLGAMDSFVHEASRDINGNPADPPIEMFGARTENGDYSNELYDKYLAIKDSWSVYMSYLSSVDYEYQTSDCVSAQALSAIDYIRQMVLARELSSVSSVYDAYIDRVNALSVGIEQGVDAYNNLISGEYSYYFRPALGYKYCFADEDIGDIKKYKHDYYVSSDWDAGLEYWYDMLQQAQKYSSGRDHDATSTPGLPRITNWAVRDTVEHFRKKFTDISSDYVKITTNQAVLPIGITGDDKHDWQTEYGYVDISAVSLEAELKYGYDFMQTQIDQRRQYILDVFNDVKSQAINLQTLAQTIKGTFASTLASYDDNREDNKLGDSVIYCVSQNSTGVNSGWGRSKDKPPKESDNYNIIIKETIGTDVFYYYRNVDGSGNFSAKPTTISKYQSQAKVIDRCNQVKQYMNAPTSYYAGTSNENYSMRDEGVYAAMDQIEHDWNALSSSVDALSAQIKRLGYNISLDVDESDDVDNVISKLIDYINESFDEKVIEKDPTISSYKKFLKAIVQLSSMYIPVKYEYDQMFNDRKQHSYFSEFTRDTELTMAALDNLSSYSVEKDTGNKEAILQQIAQMLQDYQDRVAEYRAIAEDLVGEYMLPLAFQPYQGYIEEMAQTMYDALTADVQEKTILAHQRAQDEYDRKLAPAANDLVRNVSPYENSMYRLPVAVSKRLKELYYLDDPRYLKQKNMFLTYGGRNFCYYPYYNFKNITHSSYQVHPFLWNFIRRDWAYGIAQNTFFSVTVDELEAENVAANWRKYFGDYGETKYADISRPRYPDYSGYQSRYERSMHVAENTQLVSEVVDYDGGFYPPAVEWIRANGLTKAVNSVSAAAYDKGMSDAICQDIMGLTSVKWNSDIQSILRKCQAYKTAASYNALSSAVKAACDAGGSDVVFNAVKAVQNALSGGESDTFYGRFYRHLRLESDEMAETRKYIAEQLTCYWPTISEMTRDLELPDVYDIYKYGIDSYGNMYCLYKRYQFLGEARDTVIAQGGPSYRYKQNTAGELWIRFKDHPLAFPAFWGDYPNVYTKDDKFHIAFVNLLNLYETDGSGRIVCDSKGNAVRDYELTANRQLATCIYDFEFTKNRQDVTFVTKMRGISKFEDPYPHYEYTLSDDSRDVQCYQNSWLVHCCPTQDTLTSNSGAGRQIFRLYIPSGKTDYFRSGENRLVVSPLSAVSCLDNGGQTLFQYIGSYLRGDSSIYHAYVKKHVYYNEISDVVREVVDNGDVKIFPVIDGLYKDTNEIKGRLSEIQGLSVIGSDVCIAYDDQNSVINFAAQTAFRPDTKMLTQSGEIGVSANAFGPIIGDPLNADMNSHDIFNANITLFRKRVMSKRLYDVINMNSRYTFNTNADMSYFPSYPGQAGLKKMWAYSEYYDSYNVELLGTAKDISRQISYVNPAPDPYLDAAAILSDFAHARVYQDYLGYMDETLQTIDNELIGANSGVAVQYHMSDPPYRQTVMSQSDCYIWQLSLNKIYDRFDLEKTLKLKILLFNKKCCGKNPYLFSDLSALAGEDWIDLQYDGEPPDIGEYSVKYASDYTFGYNNRVIVQSTLDGQGEAGTSDSNNISNVKSLQARFIINREYGLATLEFRFMLERQDLKEYTYVPKGQIQAVLLDVRNLDVFNYFHYLDAYGVLRVVDNFKTMEEFNQNLIKYGDGWTIYYSGHRFTQEELLNRLKSYFEYKSRMIPLSEVDLSQYDSLSDVYILQGSRRLQFKLDEGFRYELDHPGYFYPTLNAKFPMNPAQYAYRMTSFRENAAQDSFIDLFDQRNVFMLDMEDPEAMLSRIGRVDIPILLGDRECAFAYEDYLEDSGVEGLRNCDLYDVSDPKVLRFVQFETDGDDGVAADPISIPDNWVTNVGIEEAVSKIAAEEKLVPLHSEFGRRMYTQDSMGFTMSRNSIEADLMAEILRIYVNYRKYGDYGSEKIELYFNYMNYLDSPYLRLKDGKPYVDIVDNTYLSLKQDEDGVLDIVAQFRYYKGNTMYGYRNVKMASYQIYNISDDKPKFMIKRISLLEKDEGSNKSATPQTYVTVCDTALKLENAEEAGGSPVGFDVVVTFESNQPIKQAEYYLDYPFDFMEFVGAENAGDRLEGSGWTLNCEQPGYVKLSFAAGTSIASIPAKTVQTKGQLMSQGPQDFVIYVDRSVVVGQNGVQSDVEAIHGTIRVQTEPVTERLNVLLTNRYSPTSELSVFNLEMPPAGADSVTAFKLT